MGDVFASGRARPQGRTAHSMSTEMERRGSARMPSARNVRMSEQDRQAGVRRTSRTQAPTWRLGEDEAPRNTVIRRRPGFDFDVELTDGGQHTLGMAAYWGAMRWRQDAVGGLDFSEGCEVEA